MAHPQEAGWVRISVERESSSAADREVGGGLSRHDPCLTRFPGGKTLTCRFGCVPGEEVSETFLREAFAWSNISRTSCQGRDGSAAIVKSGSTPIKRWRRINASTLQSVMKRRDVAPRGYDRVFMRKQLLR